MGIKTASASTRLTKENIIKGLMVKANDGSKIVPAIRITTSTYATEIPAAMRSANYSLEQYMKKACTNGGKGTMILNCVIVDGVSFASYQDKVSNRDIKTCIHDMFCIDSNGDVALKFTYEVL